MARKKRTDNKGRVLRTGEGQNAADGRYYYRWTDATGSRNTVYATDLVSLRTKEEQIARDIQDGIDNKGASMTLNELFEVFMDTKTGIKETTRNNYNHQWKVVKDSFLGEMQICKIKPLHIKRWIVNLQSKGKKNSTIKSYATLLSSVFELALNNDYIRKNPCSGCKRDLKSESSKKALTLHEQNALLEFAQNDNVWNIHYPMILFLLSTGLRIGELIALTNDCIDTKNNVVHIKKQLVYGPNKDGKYCYRFTPPKSSSAVRDIPLTVNAKKALAKQKEIDLLTGRRGLEKKIDGKIQGLVFLTRNGTPNNERYFWVVLKRIVKDYNKTETANAKTEHRKPDLLPNISPHTLRHTFITRCVENQMDLKVIQTIAGHSDISVTLNIYTHTNADRMQDEMKKLENVMG